MAMFKLHDLPQEFLEYMVDIMHKEGHHYFYRDDAQITDELEMTGPERLFVGFTIRLFLYNKDQSGHSKLEVEWRSAFFQQPWRVTLEYYEKRVKYTGIDRFSTDVKEYEAIPDDAVYSLGIRVVSDRVFQALFNESPTGELDVEATLNDVWTFHVKVEGQVLLGMSMNSESVPRPDNQWGRRCYLKHLWMPLGTIGVYTCKLVDNTKPNWIELTHADGTQTSHHFGHGDLPNGTLLYYTIRLSFKTFIITCNFHPTIMLQETDKPNFIEATFSEALNIINFDVDIPYS